MTYEEQKRSDAATSALMTHADEMQDIPGYSKRSVVELLTSLRIHCEQEGINFEGAVIASKAHLQAMRSS